MSKSLSLPSRKKIWLFTQMALVTSFVFTLVYGGANYFANQRGNAFEWYWEWELQIPFVPEAILPYFSLNLFTFFSLFILNESQLIRYAKSIVVTILLAGVFFFVFPSHVVFERVEPTHLPPLTQWLFQGLHAWDLPYNACPSLHIALTALSLFIFQEQLMRVRHLGSKRWVIFFWIWFFVICLSVLLTHQHHVIDILGGWILSRGVFKFYYLKASR